MFGIKQNKEYDFISDDGQYKGRYDRDTKKYYAVNSKGKTASWSKEEFENALSNVYSTNKPLSESVLLVIKNKLK